MTARIEDLAPEIQNLLRSLKREISPDDIYLLTAANSRDVSKIAEMLSQGETPEAVLAYLLNKARKRMDGKGAAGDAGKQAGQASASPPGQPVILQEILPKTGLVYSEKSAMIEIISKPKLMPIKSSALVRLEKMEEEAKQILSNQQPGSSAGLPGGRPGSRMGGAPGGQNSYQPQGQAAPQPQQQQMARPSSATGRPASATGRRQPV